METLSSEDLIWTGVYSSCWAIYGDRIGISFRGLSATMIMKVPEKYLPQNQDLAVTKEGIGEVQVYPYTFIPVQFKSIKVEQGLRDLLTLVSLVRNQLNIEKTCRNEKQVEIHRKLLNHCYNKFISTYQSPVQCFKNYWCIRQKTAIIFQDYNLSILEQLENFKGERSDIFFKRVIPFVDQNPSGVMFTNGSDLDRVHEAIAISYYLYREIVLDKIVEWTALDQETIEQCFHKSDLIYREPLDLEIVNH
jgi:hypothetical protein